MGGGGEGVGANIFTAAIFTRSINFTSHAGSKPSCEKKWEKKYLQIQRFDNSSIFHLSCLVRLLMESWRWGGGEGEGGRRQQKA